MSGCMTDKTTPLQFKTSTFCRLWRRYMAVSSRSLKKSSLFGCLHFPLHPNGDEDIWNISILDTRRNLGYENFSISSSQRQTWSMFNRFRKLFAVPVVYCDSKIVSEHHSESVSGADIIERNFNLKRRQVITSPSRGVSEVDVLNYINSQTGMDRIKAVFEKDIHGQTSAELNRISSQLTTMIFMIFFGAMILSGAKGREEFIKKNKTTVFLTKGLATRRLMDAVFLESVKGGLYWTFKLGFFTSVLLSVSEGIAIYRNKTSPLEYTVAGGVAGSLAKFSLGPKGMVSGGVFGSVIGLVLGAGITQLLRYGTDTQEDRYFRKIQAQLSEEAAISQTLRPSSAVEEDNRDYEID